MQLDVELRLDPARQADVDRIRDLLHSESTRSAAALTATGSVPRTSIWSCFMPRPVGREDGQSGTGNPLRFRPEDRRELLGADVTFDLRFHLDVDVADVYRPRCTAAKRGIGVAHLGMRARQTRGFLRLES